MWIIFDEMDQPFEGLERIDFSVYASIRLTLLQTAFRSFAKFVYYHMEFQIVSKLNEERSVSCLGDHTYSCQKYFAKLFCYVTLLNISCFTCSIYSFFCHLFVVMWDGYLLSVCCDSWTELLLLIVLHGFTFCFHVWLQCWRLSYLCNNDGMGVCVSVSVYVCDGQHVNTISQAQVQLMLCLVGRCP